MASPPMESLDMVLLLLVPLSALSVLELLVVLSEVLLEELPMLDMVSVRLKPMLMLMPMLVMVMLALLLPPLPSVTVSQSEPATRFLSAPPGRSPRLSARKLLMLRSSRTVLKLSALPVLSNLFSSLTLPLLLVLTPESDPKLLSPLTVPLLLVLLPLPLLLLEELLLLPLLLPDMPVPELDWLDMLDGNL